MPVRFVIGRAGTGKTFGCFNGIVEAMRADPLGPPIYWLLPRQATFMAERELTCNSGLGAVSRARVVSFDQLARDVLADCGGCAVPEVTAMGRQMILGHLLRKNQPGLQFFASVARQAGLAAELDETFSEFERCGKDAASLKTLLGDLQNSAHSDAESQSLLNKFHDLHLLYQAYSDYLGQERLDPHRRLNEVQASLARCSLFTGAMIYVDGFADFTESERRLLTGLAQAAGQVEIMLLIDPRSATIRDPHHIPDDLNLFHRTEHTYRKLWFSFTEAGIAIDEPKLLNEVRRFIAPALVHVERGMFEKSVSGDVASDGIELFEAPDRRTEVNAAARSIRGLLRQGLRLRDIAVLMRDLGTYHELIDASFREHEIPYFVDRRRSAAHHPLLQFIRSVFLIAKNYWPHEAVMTLLKCGLSGLTLDEADELENYVLLHRIRGAAWADEQPWTLQRSLTRRGEQDSQPAAQAELERIQTLRQKVTGRLKPFLETLHAARQLSVREIVIALFKLFEDFKIRPALSQWMTAAAERSDFEQRGEHEQVWAELIGLFDQMVDLLGEERLSVGEFQEILETGLEKFDLALTPPTVDEVLVGQIDRTRTPPVKAVILIGMNEGEFPRLTRQESLISDSERKALKRRNIEIDPDSERQLLDENLLGYIAMTRASHQLILTRPTADGGGKALGPSPFWRRLIELYPGVKVHSIARDKANQLDSIGTPRQLVTSLMRWARGRPQGALDAGGPWTSLYQWLAMHDRHDDPVGIMRYRAWKALSYDNAAALSPEIADKLFPSPLRADVAQIESFAACPFQHYLHYGLGLRQREDQDVTWMDLGSVYHQVLGKLAGEIIRRRADWNELSPEQSDELIRSYAQQVGQTLRGELMMGTARNRYLLKHIEKTLSQVVASQREISRRGQFRPAFARLTFGEEGTLPPLRLATPASREVWLHGQIDRVDVIQDQGGLAVVDYKLSAGPLALDRVYYGISLQLLVYLLVLQANGEQLIGRKATPAAAFYLQLLRKLNEVRHPEEAVAADDPKFHLKVKPRGIFDGDYIHALDSGLEGGASEVVQAHINKDGQFGHRDRSDVADPADFSLLLEHVRRRVGNLADGIVSGQIGITPYRINRATPCARCDYRSICRFDAGMNRYHVLPAMKREEVLEKIK